MSTTTTSTCATPEPPTGLSSRNSRRFAFALTIRCMSNQSGCSVRCLLSKFTPAAIDDQFMPCHERRCVACEKQYGLCDLQRHTETLHGNLLRNSFSQFHQC